MRRPTPHEARLHRHGNIFSPHAGSMIIHAQRENGLAHQTMTLRPWQVQAFRLLTSRWVLVALVISVCSWSFFALQAARVPVLLLRLEHMEQDSARLDSLRRTVSLLQGRYEQVQRMLSAPTLGNREAQRRPAIESPPHATAPLKGAPVEEAKKSPK